MRILLAALIIVGLATGIWEFYKYYRGYSDPESRAQEPAVVHVDSSQLTGLPPNLESALATAKQTGANGLRSFLRTYGKAIQDPRLASIELDYVVLVSRSDLAEARTVFERVKTRTGSDSPLYGRIKELEKTYE